MARADDDGAQRAKDSRVAIVGIVVTAILIGGASVALGQVVLGIAVAVVMIVVAVAAIRLAERDGDR